ncbi:MAG: ATP-binding cassette domain-containing protein [Candidatus Marinimicrobia bacterium]|nr:ATP-binding cassette domain-containing protein [Candidatus Neomarinimicrobiota bacterium]
MQAGITASKTLLQIQNLRIVYQQKSTFFTADQTVHAVNGVSFSIRQGESFAIVGRSGCGKTSIAMSALGFVKPSAGAISFMGKNIWQLNRKNIRRLRPLIQPVFQDYGNSLNPRMTVNKIIIEALRAQPNDQTRTGNVKQLLDTVGLDSEIRWRYPHQLSGGHKQRINISRALALNPKLLILYEPGSSQALSAGVQLIELLNRLKQTYQLSYLLISHNLSIVRLLSDRIAIMKNGVFTEQGPAETLLQHPSDNHTKELIDASNLTNLSKTGLV